MSAHKTVLLQEAIEGLNLNPKSLVIDCTFGGGGHSLEMCRRYPGIKIIALDQDKNVFSQGDKFKGCDISFVNDNFRNIDKVFGKKGLEKVNGIIFDLGLSSDQLENSGRGFSFLKDEPLLMTIKENLLPEDITARDVVNTWSEKNLADIIYGYGEEKFSRRIAKGIADARKKAKIETTFDLVKIIEKVIPPKFRQRRIHYATKTFQAIRIAVNDELEALTEGLQKGFKLLRSEGRMSVISFHSLEDRIVKKFYKTKETEGEAKLIPARNEFRSSGNKKVILANNDEIKNNPRSRSAKLRILEKI